jgi:23S rRNA (guanosine2251-2'-O)-methyltransferase
MSKAKYIAGLRAVEQLLQSGAADIRKIYVEYKSANPRVESVIAAAKDRRIEIQSANRARLTQISGESRHQGIVAEIVRSSVLDEGALRSLVEARLTDADRKPLMLLILDGIQDPHNLGACLRTADAAGVDAVVVPRHGAAGLGPTVSKVATGAAESLNFAAVPNIGRVVGWLQEYGIAVIGTSDAADQSLYECDLAVPFALIMGQEEKGLRKSIIERSDHLVSLPMTGVVSSLNVSVATGICLYEALRQRQATKPARKAKKAPKKA